MRRIRIGCTIDNARKSGSSDGFCARRRSAIAWNRAPMSHITLRRARLERLFSQRLDFRMGMPRASMPSSSNNTTFRDDHSANCRIRMRATNPFLRLMNGFAHEPFVLNSSAQNSP